MSCRQLHTHTLQDASEHGKNSSNFLFNFYELGNLIKTGFRWGFKVEQINSNREVFLEFFFYFLTWREKVFNAKLFEFKCLKFKLNLGGRVC